MDPGVSVQKRNFTRNPEKLAKVPGTCVGCDIVQADHAPEAGVAQGIFYGILVRHHGRIQASSDIYFQDFLEDTVSFSNPDIDDDQLAKFLAVVVDRTGQPVEVRSNSDHFSCDVRNVKSAQSQFPLVTQPKRMINQTGGSVEERIAEERESSNAQIRTMLDEQRKNDYR